MSHVSQAASRLLALVLLVAGVNALWADPPSEKQHSFAIYLAEGMDKRAVYHGTDSWQDAKLAAEPIITDADIVSYDILQHAMTLTREAFNRIKRPPVSGTPFVVVVDGEPVYAGVFTTCASSFSFAVPSITVDRSAIFPDDPDNTLIIDRAYPTLQFGIGPDPRSDKRLIAALKGLGKLVSRGPQVDEALTQKISQILYECQPIKPGITREELLRVFTTEGGLSTPERRTYALRRCPYIKIDVQFTLSQPDQHDELPTDTIREVSRPYLAWSIND